MICFLKPAGAAGFFVEKFFSGFLPLLLAGEGWGEGGIAPRPFGERWGEGLT